MRNTMSRRFLKNYATQSVQPFQVLKEIILLRQSVLGCTKRERDKRGGNLIPVRLLVILLLCLTRLLLSVQSWILFHGICSRRVLLASRAGLGVSGHVFSSSASSWLVQNSRVVD